MALLLVVLAGCVDGDFEVDGPDVCLFGDCTPRHGVELIGAGRGDLGLFESDEPMPTALGGDQVFTVFDHDAGAAVDAAFDATIEPNGNDPIALEIVGTEPGRVRVRGVAPGGSWLVVRSGGAELARAYVAVAEVTGVTLGGNGWHDARRDRGPYGFAAGAGAVEVVLALTDERGERVADQRLEVAGADPVPGAWDTVSVEIADQDLTLSVGVGDAPPVDVVVPVVTAVERLSYDTPLGVAGVGLATLVCFYARAGDLDVVYAPWSFTVAGPAEPRPFGGAWANCASVEPTAAGRVEVTATTLGGATITGAFTVE
ncbi:MAG: hypothetical protein H6709_18525 [Kofleriaceae bacterium]|nr:hypothetical protein [Kofleriaceae bacterium]